MRFLLVNPPLAPTAEIAPPVGLCTLACTLLEEGHDVSILDLDLELHNEQSDHRKIARQKLAETLCENEPDVVGITSMYNNSLQASEIAEQVKAYRGNCVTIAGGPHFGAQGLESLRHVPGLDFVIEGEGESALVAFANYLEGRIPIEEVQNLCYRDKASTVRNTQDKQIELSATRPIWPLLVDTIDLSRYSKTISPNSARRAIYIEAGRGCPFKCTFCAPAQFWKRQYRVKSVETIVAEIKYLHEQFDYDSFMLVHDLLTFDKRFVKEFCDRLCDERLPIEWMANARVDIAIENHFAQMKKSGCWKLFFGIETASERLQAVIDKNLTQSQTLKTARALSDSGIDATCSYVIGHPDETKAELSATIAQGARLRLIGAETIQYHRLRLFPPAPMTNTDIEYVFDEETLKLEFPFSQITDSEVSTIRSKATLYTGYFAPKSLSGLPHQLAQVELFFQQLVTLAPITLATLGSILREQLIDAFYESLVSISLIDRYAIDWVGADVEDAWNILAPYVSNMQQAAAKGCKELDAIITGAREYERTRMMAVTKNVWMSPASIFEGVNCIILSLPCSIFELMETLREGTSVTKNLARTSQAMLVRGHDGVVTAFQGECVTNPS